MIVEAAQARGTGFFVAPDTLLTNVHVVGANATVTLRRTDGTSLPARVETANASYDIAVLKIDNPAPNQPVIHLGSVTTTRVGQEVIAIGTPLGFLQNTVSRGIVSALRDVDGATMVQTDAAINPGNSGGPLIDRYGQAIGVIKSGYTGREGLSFAVAIDHAKDVLAGHATPTVPKAASTSPYRALAPEVASPTDQRRADATKAFSNLMAQIARNADALDNRWRQFRAGCYEGKVSGSFSREWFAIFDAKLMQGAVSPGCGSYFAEVTRAAKDIRDQVQAADEAARRNDIFPGTVREMKQRYRLDYAGWDR
ncbi:MAG TPA: trypsin-like peptidase domain-containing protein [Vicinamibacterales bacterium]|nr:trypsin-like peptidase domain-containing protein [Vicinamibacterales bacterium]